MALIPGNITSLDKLESLFKTQRADKIINLFLRKRGITVTVTRTSELPEHSVENPEATDVVTAAKSVYGSYAGVSDQQPNPKNTSQDVEKISFKARILIATTSSSPFDAAMTGSLEEEVLYTFDDILPDDTIELITAEGSKRLMRVKQPIAVGITLHVYKKYQMTQVGGT